jgi:hypothetical protein
MAVMAARKVLSLVELLLPLASSKKPDLGSVDCELLFMGKSFKKKPPGIARRLERKKATLFHNTG